MGYAPACSSSSWLLPLVLVTEGVFINLRAEGSAGDVITLFFSQTLWGKDGFSHLILRQHQRQ